jgi:CheY-like chemotaxis protein
MNEPYILVIDDDMIMQQLMKSALTRAGYQVRIADRASQALDMIAEKKPDIVLCDMAMPIMTGLDFLRHRRTTPELADLTVIIVSSVTDAHSIHEALDLGAAAHISKPFSQAQLLKVVADNLQRGT